MYKTILSLALLFGSYLNSYAQEYPITKDVKRVVFLGNSITYSGQFVSYIDAYFTLKHPNRQLEIINVGLPSETVSGLSEEGHADGKFPRPYLKERLQRVLIEVDPDLVIVNYGMNDGIYLPFDESRFQAFQNGINWMHQAIENSGADIIHVTPPVFDERKDPAYANVLDIYSSWLVSRRYTDDWKVIDLHWPMRKSLEEQREQNPDFAFAKDGVHPDNAGHFLMAKVILLGLGEEVAAGTRDELLASSRNATKILALVERRQEILKLAWLKATGHQRPGIPDGLSLDEAQKKVAEINLEVESILR